MNLELLFIRTNLSLTFGLMFPDLPIIPMYNETGSYVS